ncbi:hypothetical protein M9H77_12689 [Catharanthus roseus]|uniref:Uncharacterized protein n=1 Tax=Catharanthus roseus TaxID=4058 RepID=A0ACC0BI41_CATRO|nr:hypothetical protein M9H77_12689 [Catharanthus roseus]
MNFLPLKHPLPIVKLFSDNVMCTQEADQAMATSSSLSGKHRKQGEESDREIGSFYERRFRFDGLDSDTGSASAAGGGGTTSLTFEILFVLNGQGACMCTSIFFQIYSPLCSNMSILVRGKRQLREDGASLTTSIDKQRKRWIEE